MIVPNDAVILIASLSEKLEDDLRVVATTLKEDPHLAVPGVVDPFVSISENVDRIRAVLRIVIEEQPSTPERIG